MHWVSGVYRVTGRPSPWVISELFEQPIEEWLPVALRYLSSGQDLHRAHPRDQLIDVISKATRLDVNWSFQLVDLMTKSNQWDNQFWPGVIEGWCAGELSHAELSGVMDYLSAEALHDYHASAIAHAMPILIGKNRTAVDLGIVRVGNGMARKLWPYFEADEPTTTTDWMMRAINSPAGNLAEYWILSIDTWRGLHEPPLASLRIELSTSLAEVLKNRGSAGALARVIFGVNLPLVAYLGLDWTREHLFPSLSPEHEHFEPAWVGVTHCSGMTPEIAEHLREPFISAVERMLTIAPTSTAERFIEIYTQMATYFIAGPNERWVTEFFKHATEEHRIVFATEIRSALRGLDGLQLLEWWNTWLRQYWENRLLGIPKALSDKETINMLGWSFYMEDVFPQVVDLAIKMEPVPGTSDYIWDHLNDHAFVEKYPHECAKLLVYVGKWDIKTWLGTGVRKVAIRLLDIGLTEDLDQELREVMASHHCSV